MRRIASDKTGSILITTLWIMAILSLLALGIGLRASLELRLSKYSMDKVLARYLAEAGFVKAQELLSKDKNDYDSLYECGIMLGLEESPETVFGYEYNKLGTGAFSIYGMIDEDRKININMDKLAKGSTGEYRRILKGLSEDITDELVDAIMDWQDTDKNETGLGGAEDFYYETLPYPYPCKNKNFESVEEILLVKGMNKDLFNKIKDNLTVYSDGKININTAPKEVLSAVIDDGSRTYAPLIENIIEVRKGVDAVEGTKDDGVFFNTNELMLCAKENFEKNRISQVTPYFTVDSKVFRIISHGTTGKITKALTYVIERPIPQGQEKIKFYHEE